MSGIGGFGHDEAEDDVDGECNHDASQLVFDVHENSLRQSRKLPRHHCLQQNSTLVKSVVVVQQRSSLRRDIFTTDHLHDSCK